MVSKAVADDVIFIFIIFTEKAGLEFNVNRLSQENTKKIQMVCTTVVRSALTVNMCLQKGKKEKSRESHNHKSLLIADTKRKRKETQTNTSRTNKRTKSEQTSTLTNLLAKHNN